MYSADSERILPHEAAGSCFKVFGSKGIVCTSRIPAKTELVSCFEAEFMDVDVDNRHWLD